MTAISPPSPSSLTGVPTRSQRSLQLAPWLMAATAGFGYFACAAVSGFFTHWTKTVSYIWLPSGWYVSVLLLIKPRHWLLVIVATGLGDVAYNFLTEPWSATNMVVAHAGNSLSAVMGAALVRRFVSSRVTMQTVQELVGVVLLAGVVGLVPAAANGAWLIQRLYPESVFFNTFIAWYASDLLGVVLLAPAVIAWQTGLRRPSRGNVRRRVLEFSALLVGVGAVTIAAFYFHWLRQTETLYVAFPFVIWAALRFGLRGATAAILLTAMLAQVFTAMGYGSLGAGNLTAAQKSIEVMVSLGVFSVVGLIPATVLATLKAAQVREAVRSHTMTLVAMGAKLPAILDSVVLAVEAECPGALCSVLLLDQTGTRLHVGAAPSLPPAYNQAIHGVGIGPNVGSCGTAAFLNQRVVVEDIETDPRWAEYRTLAAEAGLASCWSQPFHDSAGRILGTFAIYYPTPQTPTAADLRLIAAASQIAAIATERKHLEEQFLRAQRMESIGTLAGGLAHDFNNLLTPILLSVGLLRQFEKNPEHQKLLDQIGVCAKRGANLVNQVLTFARGAEGERVVLNLGLVVHEIEAIVTNTFPKNIACTLQVPRDLALVMGDRTQLEQVMLNLCVNARDAMPEGGRLEIKLRDCRVDEKFLDLPAGISPGAFVEIEVADSGCGMTPEVVQRIFEPFYTSKELGHGTGLGLSTALGIVRNHGGFILVASKPGQGSRFTIYLPAYAGSHALGDERTGSRAPVHGQGELILFVDDEAVILQAATQALMAFNYRVLVATNGAEALELVAAHRGKLAAVVTDMMMPVMGGKELIAALREVEPNLPVITASGLKSEQGKTGAHAHLAKPYSADDLAAVIARVLGRTQP